MFEGVGGDEVKSGFERQNLRFATHSDWQSPKGVPKPQLGRTKLKLQKAKTSKRFTQEERLKKENANPSPSNFTIIQERGCTKERFILTGHRFGGQTGPHPVRRVEEQTNLERERGKCEWLIN